MEIEDNMSDYLSGHFKILRKEIERVMEKMKKNLNSRIDDENNIKIWDVFKVIDKFHGQQPDVKGIARLNGEGECTGLSIRSPGSVKRGGVTQYPSADVNSQMTDNVTGDKNVM